jgi:hypothetical protein
MSICSATMKKMFIHPTQPVNGKVAPCLKINVPAGSKVN